MGHGCGSEKLTIQSGAGGIIPGTQILNRIQHLHPSRPNSPFRLINHRGGAFISLGAENLNLCLSQFFGKFRYRGEGAVDFCFPDTGENDTLALFSGGKAEGIGNGVLMSGGNTLVKRSENVSFFRAVSIQIVGKGRGKAHRGFRDHFGGKGDLRPHRLRPEDGADSQGQDDGSGNPCQRKAGSAVLPIAKTPSHGCPQLCCCMIALVHVHLNTPPDDRTEQALHQLPGGMLPGEHFVEHHTGSVKVGTGICLGKAILLRGGVAGGAHNSRIGIPGRIGYPGDIEVNEHQLAAPENQIFRLDIPVDDSCLM